MTTIRSPLKTEERKSQEITLTLRETERKKKYTAPATMNQFPSQTQTSPESGNVGIKNYHPDLFLQSNPLSITSDYQSNKIEDRDYIYNSGQKRRGRFLSPRSDYLENFPRTLKKKEATNLHQQRSQRLKVYLDSLKNEARVTGESEFSEKVLNLSWLVWEALKSRLEEKKLCLEVPDACPGSRDSFMYTWSKAEHYLECEIFGTGEIEFFYRNRNNGQVWGEDTTLEQGFSTDILDKASLFIA